MPPQIQLLNADIKAPSSAGRMPGGLLSDSFRLAQNAAADLATVQETQLGQESSLFRRQLAEQTQKLQRSLAEADALQERKEALENQAKAKAASAEIAVEAGEIQQRVQADPRVPASQIDSAFAREFDKHLQKRMAGISKGGMSTEAMAQLKIDLISIRGHAVAQMRKESLKRTVEAAEGEFFKYEDSMKTRWLGATDPAEKDALLNDYTAYGLDMVKQGAFDAAAFQKRVLAFGRELKIENITQQLSSDPLMAMETIKNSDLLPSEKRTLERQSIAQMEMLNNLQTANEKREQKELRGKQEMNELNLSHRIRTAKSNNELNSLMAEVTEMGRTLQIGDDRAIAFQGWIQSQIEHNVTRAEAAQDRAERRANQSDEGTRTRTLQTILQRGGDVDIVKLAGLKGLSFGDRMQLVNETQQLQKSNSFWKDDGIIVLRNELKDSLTLKAGLLDSLVSDLEPELKAKLNSLPSKAENEFYLALSRRAGPNGVITPQMRDEAAAMSRLLLEQYDPVIKSIQNQVKPRYKSERDAVEAYKRGDLTDEEARIEAARWAEVRRIAKQAREIK
jgi:hypothetical protein